MSPERKRSCHTWARRTAMLATNRPYRHGQCLPVTCAACFQHWLCVRHHTTAGLPGISSCRRLINPRATLQLLARERRSRVVGHGFSSEEPSCLRSQAHLIVSQGKKWSGLTRCAVKAPIGEGCIVLSESPTPDITQGSARITLIRRTCDAAIRSGGFVPVPFSRFMR